MRTSQGVENLSNDIQPAADAFERLHYIRAGAETRRYHTWPVIREQNVAEHGAIVAILCSWLADIDDVELTANLAMAAVTHDWAEHVFGDMPAPTKRGLPPVMIGQKEVSFRTMWNTMESENLIRHGLHWESRLTDTEKYILKLADAGEGCFRCILERSMGNRVLDPVYSGFRTYLKDLSKSLAGELLQVYVDKEWKFATR